MNSSLWDTLNFQKFYSSSKWPYIQAERSDPSKPDISEGLAGIGAIWKTSSYWKWSNQEQKQKYEIIREEKKKKEKKRKETNRLRKLKFYYHLGFTLGDDKVFVRAKASHEV